MIKSLKPYTQMSKYDASTLSMLFATFIWGTTFVVIKGALTDIDPVNLLIFRFFIATVVTGAYLKWLRLPLFTNWDDGVVLGVLMYIFYITQTVGLLFTTASNAAFITGMSIVFIPIISFLSKGKKPTKENLLAIVLAISGLWLLTGGVKGANLGDWLNLITAISYAIYVFAIEKYNKEKDHPFQMLFQQFLTVFLLILLTSVSFGIPVRSPGVTTVLSIGYLAIFASVTAFAMQIKAQKNLSNLKTTAIVALEPVFAAIFAWGLKVDPFSWVALVGGSLIFVAMLVSEAKLSFSYRFRLRFVKGEKIIEMN